MDNFSWLKQSTWLMKLIICVFLTFIQILFFKSLSAQPTIQWQKNLGGSEYDEAKCVRQTTDGGFIIAGYTLSNNGDVSGNHGGLDFWVVKLTNTGAIQWKKSLGGTNNEWAYSIQPTNDGGYIVVGSTLSNNGDVLGNHGDEDCWVVKLSSSGTIQWQKALGGSDWDEAWSIQQTSDGGYILAGRTRSNDGDVSGNHGAFDIWVVKLDGTGTLAWQKSLGGSGDDIGYAVRQTPDGGYIVTGESGSDNGDVSGLIGGTDYWVIKLSPEGNLEWQKMLGSSSLDFPYDITPTNDGGYIVVGIASANSGDVTGNHDGFDYWVVKMNNQGDIQWQKSLGGSGQDYAQAVQQTSDGGYVIAGSSPSTDGDVIGNDGVIEFWIVKLTEVGELQWQKTLGGTKADRAFSIQQTSDGGYIVCGYAWSNDGDVSVNKGKTDYWVVKLSPESSSTSNLSAQTLEIYPNPATSTISLNFSDEESTLSVQITDLLGQIIHHQTISTNQPINISDLPNGFYLLSATTPSGTVFSGKFTKQD